MSNSNLGVGRRTFTKSSTGCLACRERKVKCDETHPICKNCTRHFKSPRPCNWGPASGHASIGPSRSSSVALSSRPRPPLRAHHLSPSPGPASPSIHPVKSNYLLRFYYHYLTTLAPIMPQAQNATVRSLWTNDIPQLAFDADYLLNAILAVSALHVQGTLAPNSTALLDQSQVYYHRCLKSFQQAINQLNRNNAEAVCVTGMLLAFISMLHPRQSNIPYSLPIPTFHLLKGMHTMVERSLPWLLKSNSLPLMNKFGANPSNRLPRRSYLLPSETVDLPSLLDGLAPESDDYLICKEALSHSIVLQNALVEGDTVPRLHRKFALFCIGVSTGFIKLLENFDDRAMVIWAHHAAMQTCVEASFWLEGMAEYEVYGIAKLVSNEWKECLQWPLWMLERKWKPRVCGNDIMSVAIFDDDEELEGGSGIGP